MPIRYTLPAGFPTALGDRLKQLRKTAGMTQTQLAEHLDTQNNRVSEWETGQHLPTLIVLHRYAEVFNTTVAEILKSVL